MNNTGWIVIEASPMSGNRTTEVVAPLQAVALERCGDDYGYATVIGATGGSFRIELQEYERIKKILLAS